MELISHYQKQPQENTWVTFLLFYNKVAGLETCNSIKKETLAQVFLCQFWDISKNTFLKELLRATAFTLHPNSHYPKLLVEFCFTFTILHCRKVVTDIINMQIMSRPKKQFYLSNGSEHFVTALSTRRFLFLIKQLSMLGVILFPWKQSYLMARIRLSRMQKPRI